MEKQSMVFDMNITTPELIEQYGDYIVVYLPPGPSSPISVSVMMIL